MSWLDLSGPDLSWLDLSWLDLSWLYLSWFHQSWFTRIPFRFPPDTLKTPYRHPPDSQRHLPDTRQTQSAQFPNTLWTPTRQSLKIRHVGAFLLPEARWGLLFQVDEDMLHRLHRLMRICGLFHWENKVNSFSNQLKLSWVCKLEWSLTKDLEGWKSRNRHYEKPFIYTIQIQAQENKS